VDMWGHGVGNWYSPEQWPLAAQQQVEALRVKATSVYLGEAEGNRSEEMIKLAKEAEELCGVLQAVPSAPDILFSSDQLRDAAVEAVTKLGLFILPPADFRDPRIQQMTEKKR